MTSNDLVIPAGITLRIPSLLVFPGQVSCGEKPKAMVFPFCSRGAALRLMPILVEEHVYLFQNNKKVKSKEIHGSFILEAKRESNMTKKK